MIPDFTSETNAYWYPSFGITTIQSPPSRQRSHLLADPPSSKTIEKRSTFPLNSWRHRKNYGGKLRSPLFPGPVLALCPIRKSAGAEFKVPLSNGFLLRGLQVQILLGSPLVCYSPLQSIAWMNVSHRFENG